MQKITDDLRHTDAKSFYSIRREPDNIFKRSNYTVSTQNNQNLTEKTYFMPQKKNEKSNHKACTGD